MARERRYASAGNAGEWTEQMVERFSVRKNVADKYQ